jgi:hypothetical protein
MNLSAMLNSANYAHCNTIDVGASLRHSIYTREESIMSTRYQAGTSQATETDPISSSQATATDQASASQANISQGVSENRSVTLDSIPRNVANQASTEYGGVMLEMNHSTLERHIVEAKMQLNIARDQLRTLTKANRDLIAGNVTSYVSTGNVAIGGALYAVIESKLDFGARLGRLQFNGALGGLPVGINAYNGGAEFFLSPDQIAALGTIDVQVDATPAQCFIYWRHNMRILGAFYGTGSGVSGFGAVGNGTFKQIS